VGFSILGHFISHTNSGTAMKLSDTKVCISNGVPGGRDVSCWRVDPGTDVDPGLTREARSRCASGAIRLSR
jgi:hypothetical protein